ncbi:MAG: biotin/lipoyl-binding protein [Erysipelotrichaceae bacterium]|nr:biotin/lipoyl-binding protein [Erysipelotrichaceae bacterium]MBR5049038.1 biotin/lipoyl-binding protein [Erysipelotrichaceae bacterium]
MKLYRIKVNGKVYEVEVEAVEEKQGAVSAPASQPVRESKSEGHNEILAPIAGKILEIRVKVGETVTKGQTVMIIEAMKLENEIQSAFDGKVKEILVENGSDVHNKDVLIVLE